MTRRSLVAVAVLVCVALSGTLAAAKGRSHGSSHRSSRGASRGSSHGATPRSSRSSTHGTKAGASPTTVHVEPYTKKDGTHVAGHDRKAPEPKGEPGSVEEARTSPPIRLFLDPVTGRKTFTNAPVVTPSTTPPSTSLMIPPTLPARSSATRSARPTTRHRVSAAVPGRASPSAGVSRTGAGRIARSQEAKRLFEVQTGYPHGRPGYVVDHVTPLACGGADRPSNMQWQTVAEAKAKDKTERIACR
jgi:hypothetical protein